MAEEGPRSGAAEDEGGRDAREPNLELPSLSLGLRRRKKGAKKPAAPVRAGAGDETREPEDPAPQAGPDADAAGDTHDTAETQPTRPTPPPPPTAKPAPAPPAATKAAPAPPEPPAPPTPQTPKGVAPPPPAAPDAPEPPATTPGPPPGRPPASAIADGVAPPVATPMNPTPAPPALSADPTADTDTDAGSDSGADPAATTPTDPGADPGAAAPATDPEPGPDAGAAREKEPSRLVTALARLDDLEIRLPKVAPRTAAILTGIVCGLVAVLLGWLSAAGCQAVRGTGTCGGFGLVALIAILAIEVILGGTLLRSWGISEPTSTAFLGVGLVAVAAMLFFLGSIGSVWMILVIPVLTAVMFLLSWWVTDTVIDVDE